MVKHYEAEMLGHGVKIGICDLHYHPSVPSCFMTFFSNPYSPFEIFNFFITLVFFIKLLCFCILVHACHTSSVAIEHGIVAILDRCELCSTRCTVLQYREHL